MTGKMLHFADRPIEFLRQFSRAETEKNIRELPIVPEGTLLPAGKARPKVIAENTEIADDGARIVEFIGTGYEARGSGDVLDMGDVSLFALRPGRLRYCFGIRAVFNDLKDTFPKLRADFLAQGGNASTVTGALTLDGIMEQRRNGFVLTAAVFEDDSRDTDEMGNVGDVRFLSDLLRMEPCRKGKGSFEGAVKILAFSDVHNLLSDTRCRQDAKVSLPSPRSAPRNLGSRAARLRRLFRNRNRNRTSLGPADLVVATNKTPALGAGDVLEWASVSYIHEHSTEAKRRTELRPL
jgi:hypothetical protein